MAHARQPVTDWTTDFDHHDPHYASDAPSVWAELRTRRPVAHTDRYHGAWMPVRYEDIAAIVYDTTTFSSRSVILNEQRPEEVTFQSPPITSDPPAHTPHRQALLSRFTPKAIASLESDIAAICERLVDGVLRSERPDAAIDFARHLPVEVTSALLGLPASDAEQFRAWVQQLIVQGPTDIAVGRRATSELMAYLQAQMDDRRRNGGDDLVTWVAAAAEHGDAVSEADALGMLFLLLVAGIDTTWSSIGSMLWHLATHPDDQARLRAEPELVETAVEEFLRFYAPVSIARVVTADTTVGGEAIAAGQRILIPFPAANRDPDVFDEPDRVIIDRAENRHIAFGLGAHRCLGSNLARMMLQVSLRTWLARTPTFRLADDATIVWTGGQVRGPRAVPITFQAG